MCYAGDPVGAGSQVAVGSGYEREAKKVNPGLKKNMLRASLVPKINFLSIIKILSRLDTSPPSFTKWTRKGGLLGAREMAQGV